MTLRCDALDADLAVACDDAPGARQRALRRRAAREDHDQPARRRAAATATCVKGVVRDLGYFGDQSLYRVRLPTGADRPGQRPEPAPLGQADASSGMTRCYLSWDVGSTILLRA